ncbi:MAG: hypothetical protein JOY79_12175 [Acidobacteriaceae bacterium]|nr:hypothetical protein [Acidobacteriaceae bacterium]
MSWVSEEAHARSQSAAELNESERERQFDEAAAQRWGELRQELRGDTDDFNSQGGAADYSESANTCEVQAANTGLTLRARFDPSSRTVHYDYESDSRRSAPPEGGILSMRLSRYRRAELYSSDEHLTSEEARRLLLEPVFFPPGEQPVAA